MAQPHNAKIFYIRITIDPEIAKEREKKKYDDESWISSFDDYRVNTVEKMLQNIENRKELHEKLKTADIPNLAGDVDNNDSLDDLQKQVVLIADKIRASL